MKIVCASLVLGFTFYLAGCASTSVETIQGPDGNSNQLISCADVKDCYAKATSICGKYKIVNSSTDTSGTWGAPGVPMTNVKLLVECLDKP